MPLNIWVFVTNRKPTRHFWTCIEIWTSKEYTLQFFYFIDITLKINSFVKFPCNFGCLVHKLKVDQKLRDSRILLRHTLAKIDKFRQKRVRRNFASCNIWLFYLYDEEIPSDIRSECFKSCTFLLIIMGHS